MDKVFLIDKEDGITSHDVVYRLRRKLNIKKIGHTGTLDPFATGLLIVCVGESTKIARFIEAQKKTYVASLKLGIKELNKKNAILEVKEKIRDFVVSPDIWLLFAPLKKDNTDFVIQKATELGCRKIIPIITKHTITKDGNYSHVVKEI